MYFFSLLVNGNNLFGMIWKDNFGNIGIFGEVRIYIGFQIVDGLFMMIIFDENNFICRMDILIILFLVCFNICDIRFSVIIELVCFDNGMLSNFNDDVFSFMIEVEGDLVGSNGWEVLIGGEVVVIGNYGELIEVGLLVIVNGDV